MTLLKKTKKQKNRDQWTQNWLFEKINKMGKPLIKLILKIKSINSKIRNKKRECNHRYTRDFFLNEWILWTIYVNKFESPQNDIF